MKNFAPALALDGLAFAVIGAADVEPVPRLVDAGLRSDGAYRKLAWLCDRIGPRLSGSENLEKAVSWSAEEMKRDGLDKVHTEKAMVPHWVRGNESARSEEASESVP